MSLYNLINGVNPCTFFILPMLGKHPDEYPRFRDCFIDNEEHPEYDNHIHVFTRTGGGNREAYVAQNNEMRAMETFLTDFDDSFDSTYASWIFSVPEKWKADFKKITSHKLEEVSEEYQAELRRVFPKLEEKFDKIFSEKTKENPPTEQP